MIKIKKEYVHFINSQGVKNLVFHLAWTVAKNEGLKLDRMLEYLKLSCGDSSLGFEPVLRLQNHFFTVLDDLYKMTPDDHRKKDFSFFRDFSDSSELRQELERCVVFYSLGFVRFFVCSLTCWACLVKELGGQAIGYGQLYPAVYKNNDARIDRLLLLLHAIAFGAGPYSQDEQKIEVIDLNRNVEDVFEFFRSKNSLSVSSIRDVGLSIVIAPDQVNVSFKNNNIYNLIMMMVQVEGCFDALLNGVVRPYWHDLRTGGHAFFSVGSGSLEPAIDLFSLFPESVSYDDRLYATLFSLGRHRDGCIPRLEMILDKNKKLIKAVGVEKKGRCPKEIEEYILKYDPFLNRIYDKWKINKKEIQLLTGQDSIDCFLNMFPANFWPFERREAGKFINVLLQADSNNNKKRTFAQMMNIIIWFLLEKTFDDKKLQKWMVTILDNKKDEDAFLCLDTPIQ